MCLILFSYLKHPRYRLILAANRDEFYERPTKSAGFWEEDGNILAGKDLKLGGTWLGITRNGRFAAITNYREPGSFKPDAPSRGKLVSGFLEGAAAPCDYLRAAAVSAGKYNGFNILVGDTDSLCYFSNRDGGVKELVPGLYGLSNHLLDTPWPKVQLGKRLLGSALNGDFRPEELFRILGNSIRPDDSQLPDTGIGLDWERILSSVFIKSPVYGTRSSTLVTVDYEGNVDFTERVFNSHPEPEQVNHFSFTIE
jgi:uncharacterized protein with NRDE domain